MKLSEFSKKLYDFHKEIGEVKHVEELLLLSMDKYNEWLNDINESEFAQFKGKGKTNADKKADVLAICEDVIIRANDAILNYIRFEKKGFDDFYNIFFPGDKPSVIANIQPIPAYKNFYRVRTAKNYQLYDRKGLFIIPYDSEESMGKYRFNPEGLSCLYLASTLYLAWEECRRPDINMMNFARFVNVKPLQVMPIRIASRMQTIGDLVMAYFALICCAETNDTDKYKIQYTVPNLFMRILIEYNKHGQPIDGIRYMSSRRFNSKDLLFDVKDIDDAYVFPPKEFNPLCDSVQDVGQMFSMTEPRSLFLYKAHRLELDSTRAKVSNYSYSLFAKLEDILKQEALGGCY